MLALSFTPCCYYFLLYKKCPRPELNQRPCDSKAGALPSCQLAWWLKVLYKLINCLTNVFPQETIRNVSPYWSCLKFLVALPENQLVNGGYDLDLAMTKLKLSQCEEIPSEKLVISQDMNENQLFTPRQSVGDVHDEAEGADSSKKKSVPCPQDADGNDNPDKKPSVSDIPGPSTSGQSEGEKTQTLSDYLAENAKV